MKKFEFLLILLICFLFACQPATSVETDSKTTVAPTAKNEVKAKPIDRSLRLTADGAMSRDGIKLTPVSDSPSFEKASLEQSSPKNNETYNEAIQFDYSVEGFRLGRQTSDALDKVSANSAEGQHIRSILNNQPSEAFYRSAFSKNLKPGHYIHLAYLARSYYEGVKEKSAYKLSEFYVGDGKKRLPFDANAAHLFYSLPEGDYIGKGNVERILFDCYLVNTDLSAAGNKLRLRINGTEFILKEWQPYWIEGLPMGSNKVSLELIDAKGQRVPGRFNFTQRKFYLYDEAPADK